MKKLCSGENLKKLLGINGLIYFFLFAIIIAVCRYSKGASLVIAGGIFILIFLLLPPHIRDYRPLCVGAFLISMSAFPASLSLLPIPLALYLSYRSASKWPHIWASLFIFAFYPIQLATNSFIFPLISCGILFITETVIFIYELHNRKFNVLFPICIIALIISFVEKISNIIPQNIAVIFITISVIIICLYDIRLRFNECLSPSALEIDYYRTLALSDSLTKGGNRMAYYKDLERIWREREPERLCLVLFDLNNLKQINDAFGHNCGDKALCDTYDCIRREFEEIGTCYRIGGDEFACLIETFNRHIFSDRLNRFYSSISEINRTSVYDFGVAVGYAQYDNEHDRTFEDLSNRVDKIMYENKKKLRIHEPICQPH